MHIHTVHCSFPYTLGAIYLKNTINKYWKVRITKDPSEAVYVIRDDEKAIVRQHIVEAVVQSPTRIRYGLPLTKERGSFGIALCSLCSVMDVCDCARRCSVLTFYLCYLNILSLKTCSRVEAPGMSLT